MAFLDYSLQGPFKHASYRIDGWPTATSAKCLESPQFNLRVLLQVIVEVDVELLRF